MNYLFYLFYFQTEEPLPSVGWLDIIWLLARTAIALALVCGLAILIFRYILPRLNVVSYSKSIINVVDAAPLDARKRLMIVKTAGKYMLLAVSESGVQLISELDGAEVESEVADLQKLDQNSGNNSFSQVIDRFRRK